MKWQRPAAIFNPALQTWPPPLFLLLLLSTEKQMAVEVKCSQRRMKPFRRFHASRLSLRSPVLKERRWISNTSAAPQTLHISSAVVCVVKRLVTIWPKGPAGELEGAWTSAPTLRQTSRKTEPINQTVINVTLSQVSNSDHELVCLLWAAAFGFSGGWKTFFFLQSFESKVWPTGLSAPLLVLYTQGVHLLKNVLVSVFSRPQNICSVTAGCQSCDGHLLVCVCVCVCRPSSMAQVEMSLFCFCYEHV